METIRILSLLLLCALFSTPSYGQSKANYDESAVPPYQLPALLQTSSGELIKDHDLWESKKRPEILGLFASEMFGKTPNEEIEVSFEVKETAKNALEGKATRKQIAINCSNGAESIVFNLLVYIPNDVDGPVPAVLGLNFYGNHTIHSDPDIILTESWVKNNKDFGIKNNRATEASRGVRDFRWEVEYIISQGYALATMYYGEIDPDFDDGFENGLHALFQDNEDNVSNFASISAWAWGMSRGLDYLIQDAAIRSDQVISFGHSRLGKTSLWAGAQDKRFALVISNNSGCGGAALSRRKFGETLQVINTRFPHWFCQNFKQYNDAESLLPIDQHMLLALIAPRPLYVASASEDRWADPRGEFLAAQEASKVYHLYRMEGLEDAEFPDLNQPIQTGKVGYHIRKGKHNVTLYDWEQYLKFADTHFHR